MNRPQRVGFSNGSNRKFYEQISEEAMDARVHEVGLDGATDLSLIADLLAEKDRPGSRCWELGAGYGRVVEYLLRRTEHLQVEAWEYASRAAARLEDRYEANHRVRVYACDVLSAAATGRDVDLALWMFSGFLEFPPEQQRLAIQLLGRRLVAGGVLVIDIGGIEAAEQDEYLEVPAPQGSEVLRVHLLTEAELIGMVVESGEFRSIRHQRYALSSGATRVTCAFRRSSGA